MKTMWIETETLNKLLENQHYEEETQSTALTSFLSVLAMFPDFDFGDDISYSMEDLFIEKYKEREICVEDELVYLKHAKRVATDLVVKYVPKIKMWLDNFNDLFKFTVKLTIKDDSLYSDGNENKYYLNPVNSTAINNKLQNLDTSNKNGSSNRTITRDVLQSVWGKTRANLLAQIFDLKSIYSECLEEFQVLFMQVF